MRIVAAAVVVVLSVGCVPDRDNPQDPAIAPKALLVMVNIGPGEACPFDEAPLPILDEYDGAADVSRGRCLALDGRPSTDPQGEDDIKDYLFTLPPALGFPDEQVVLNTTGLLVLDDVYRRALPTDRDLEFSLRVRDKNRNFGRTTATVKLRNERPNATIRAGYSVPAGGLPWSPGTPITVVLDGSKSNDPDGDVLRYCWSAPGVPEVCTPSPEGRLFSYDVPLAAGRYVVKLRTKDAEVGELEDGNTRISRTANASVWVEPPVLWETDTITNATDLQRIDTSSFPTIPNLNLLAGSAPAFFDEATGPKRFRSFSYPAGAPGPEYVYPDQALPQMAPTGGFVLDPERNRFWTIRPGSGPDLWRPTLTSLDQSLQFTDLGLSDDAYLIKGSRGLLSSIGGQGELWIASASTAMLVSIESPGIPPHAESIDAIPIGLASRPGGSEMWVLVQEPSTTAFRVYDAMRDASPDSLSLGQVAAETPIWIDSAEFWLPTHDFGLLRIDADVLRRSLADGVPGDFALVLATTATFPAGGAEPFVVDRDTGELWFPDKRLASDFSVHYSDELPRFIDPDGYTWSFGMKRTRSLGDDRTMEKTALLSPGYTPSFDVTRGSVWILQKGPTVLQEITSEGVLGRRIPTVTFGGESQLLPDWDEVTVSPDGTTAFALDQHAGGYSIDQLDLTQFPPTARRIKDYLSADPELLYSYAGFHSSLSGADPFAWTVEFGPTEMYPVRISDGAVTRDTNITISSQFGDNIGIARSLTGDAACIATMERDFVSGSTFTLTVRLYRVVAGSSAQQLDFRQFNYIGGSGGGSSYALPFVASTRSPTGGEMCWTGMLQRTNPLTVDTLTVFGAVEGMGTVRSFAYTGGAGESIRAVVPIGPDEVYFLRGGFRVRRHSPNVSGVLVGETVITPVDPVGDLSSLISPEAKNF